MTKEQESSQQGSQPSILRELPTDPTHFATKAMHLGTSMFQTFTPVKQICALFNGVHFYVNDPKRHVLANHYCSHLTEDLRQCVIYDKHDSADAKLIGVEYIISRKMFEELPEEEKRFWHSHTYEVTSGLLMMPGIPQAMEVSEMQKLVNTYGKTYHLWQVDKGHPLPYGEPQLMGAFTQEGQLNMQLLKMRDGIFGTDTVAMGNYRRNNLTNILPTAKGADSFVPSLSEFTPTLASQSSQQQQSSQQKSSQPPTNLPSSQR